jgi:UDP-GlcNAc3NAcA epimerase
VKLLTIVGARPQFIKAAPLSKALAGAGISEVFVDSGQHYDQAMAGNFFKELELPAPAYSLGVGSGSHGKMTGRLLESIETVLLKERPRAVIVYGDTNTTLAGALAAAKLNIPVVHIEAGLRSYRAAMPEEINRRLTDHVSQILLCPSQRAVENLAKEGLTNAMKSGVLLSEDECRSNNPSDQPFICNVGDIMFDALLAARARKPTVPLVDQLGARNYVLVTIHRAESTNDPDIFEGLIRNIAELGGFYNVLFPVHPRTRKCLEEANLGHLLESPNIHCLEPMSYGAFVKTQSNARVVVTDSGGVQKESFMLGTPCLTLREETEWTETVEMGRNRLLGLNPESLLDAVRETKDHIEPTIRPYGDGRASARIVAVMEACLS